MNRARQTQGGLASIGTHQYAIYLIYLLFARQINRAAKQDVLFNITLYLAALMLTDGAESDSLSCVPIIIPAPFVPDNLIGSCDNFRVVVVV